MAEARVWFKAPVLGTDPLGHDEFLSSRHVLFADRCIQDASETVFLSEDGEVVGRWETRLVDHVAWTQDLEKRPEMPTNVERLAGINADHPRAYLPWLPEEDEELRAEALARISLDEVARKHQRQKSAIRSRLAKLDLS